MVFLSRFLSKPGQVGSVCPSSSFLVKRMLSRVPWSAVDHVVELGAGTGRITREILQRKPARTELTVFEKDPVMQEYLADRYPGLAIHAEAENLQATLAANGTQSVDAVVSGLPFALFSPDKQERILDQVHGALQPGGVMVAFQYSPLLLRNLRRHFRRVDVNFVLWNLPPALVLTCHK